MKDDRLKAITAIVPAISDISKSPMMGFFKPEEEVISAKEAYDKGESDVMYLNFMPRAFDEGAAYYYTSRGNRKGYSNLAVAWSQLELVKYNVPVIMKDMKKPYMVITGENAWSRPSSEEVYNAVPGNKEIHVIPEAGHFDMYDLEPFVTEAFEYILPFFAVPSYLFMVKTLITSSIPMKSMNS
ncbi:MAG: alpha/beta hydrolase [Erysipelotrichaceae bacterium]|nr:alpha/beta hydrolase [Erysipelotrichaceae bacterium]